MVLWFCFVLDTFIIPHQRKSLKIKWYTTTLPLIIDKPEDVIIIPDNYMYHWNGSTPIGTLCTCTVFVKKNLTITVVLWRSERTLAWISFYQPFTYNPHCKHMCIEGYNTCLVCVSVCYPYFNKSSNNASYQN